MQPVNEQDLQSIVNQLQTQLQTPKPKQNRSFTDSKSAQTFLSLFIAIGGIGTLVLWLFIGYVYLAPKHPKSSQTHTEVTL